MLVLRTLFTTALCACTLSRAQPEMFVPPQESSDAGSADAAVAKVAPVDAGSSTAAGRGEPSAGSTAPAPTATATAGTTGTAGRMGTGGTPAAPSDAATPQAPDGSQPLDDTLCAFELAGCLLLDPLNYEACLRMNLARCDLLAADGGTPAPSPACSMQTADCIARNPDKASECLAMQATCTL